MNSVNSSSTANSNAVISAKPPEKERDGNVLQTCKNQLSAVDLISNIKLEMILGEFAINAWTVGRQGNTEEMPLGT